MKIKKFIFILLMSFLWIINVSAATLEIKPEEKNTITINQGESGVIVINLKDIGEDTVSQVEFDLDYDKELISISPFENNQFGYSQLINKDNIFINRARKDFTNGSIISFHVTNLSSEDAKTDISIKNVKISETLIEDEISPLSIVLKKQVITTTRTLNTSASLTGFKVSNGANVKPAFSKDVKEYKIFINKDTIKQVTITPAYEQTGVNMSVECTLGCSPDTSTINKLNLVIGKNEATFTFTSEDGKNTESYKFIIYRGPTTDGSNLLSALSIEGAELKEKFDKSNLDYTTTVPYNVENLTVNAVPEDENADVSIKGDTNLSVGENVITITVTSAETMEKKIYNITITREEFVPDEENNTIVTPTIEKQEPKKNNNIKLIVIIGVISTLIIAIAAYFIFFYKGKKKKNNKAVENLEILETKSKLQNEIIDEDKEPTSVDDALKDLMKTKEMSEIDD